jgi:hypothetical protein
VDEILNEQQRVILSIMEKMKGSAAKELYVIHNYKRLEYSDPHLSKYIEDQIVKPFGAKQMTGSSYPGLLAEDVKGFFPKAVYYSEWPESEKTAYHFVLFKHNGENIKKNDALFNYLSSMVFDQGPNFINRGPILERIALAVKIMLPQFITISDSEDSTRGNFFFPQRNCNAFLKPAMFENKQIKVRPWELIVRAPGTSLGAYQPKNYGFTGKNDFGEFHQIRVDLPGVGVEVLAGESPPANTSYFSVSKKIRTESERNSYKIIISGTRYNNINDLDASSFGYFEVAFTIENRYNKKNPEKNFFFGELTMRFYMEEDD